MKALTKQGYLLKGLFWNDPGSSASAKVFRNKINVHTYTYILIRLNLQAFKKRWFVLRYSEGENSFILEYFKVCACDS